MHAGRDECKPRIAAVTKFEATFVIRCNINIHQLRMIITVSLAYSLAQEWLPLGSWAKLWFGGDLSIAVNIYIQFGTEIATNFFTTFFNAH